MKKLFPNLEEELTEGLPEDACPSPEMMERLRPNMSQAELEIHGMDKREPNLPKVYPKRAHER